MSSPRLSPRSSLTSSLGSASISSLNSERSHSSMDRTKPALRKPGTASGTTSSSRIPPKTRPVRTKSPGSVGRSKSPVATSRRTFLAQTLSKESAPKSKSLTRTGGRAVAASLKNGGTNQTDQGHTGARKTSLTVSRRDKPPPHPKISTMNTTSSSPAASQGRVRGIRTATAAKVQPLKIPPALRSNISFTELKKQNQMLMKDIGQLKSDSKENSGKHNDDLDKVKTQLETTEQTVKKLEQEIESKTAFSATQQQLVSKMQSKLDQADIDKERLLLVLEGSGKDVLTGEGIAALQEEGAESQRKQHEFQQLLDSYEQMLSSVMSSFEQTNNELKLQHSSIEEQYNLFQSQLLAES